MKKKKLVIMAAGIVAAMLIALAGFLLFRGIAQLKTAQNNLDRAELELRSYYAKDPFPSAENVRRESENVALLEDWQKKLLGALMAGQVLPDNERSPSAFISLLSETKSELLNRAGDSIAENFAFGFDRYFAVDGARPAPADVPRLTQQLLIIDSLCRALIDEHIVRLTGVKRDEFEEDASASRRNAVQNPDAGKLMEGKLFAKLRFTLEFETKEGSLLRILNRLVKNNMFILIDSMEISRVMPDVVIPRFEDEESGAPGGAVVPPASGEAVAVEAPVAPAEPAEPLSRAERLVSGLELEQPMKVKLELDVYRFRDSEQEQA